MAPPSHVVWWFAQCGLTFASLPEFRTVFSCFFVAVLVDIPFETNVLILATYVHRLTKAILVGQRG